MKAPIYIYGDRKLMPQCTWLMFCLYLSLLCSFKCIVTITAWFITTVVFRVKRIAFHGTTIKEYLHLTAVNREEIHRQINFIKTF